MSDKDKWNHLWEASNELKEVYLKEQAIEVASEMLELAKELLTETLIVEKLPEVDMISIPVERWDLIVNFLEAAKELDPVIALGIDELLKGLN